MGVFGTEGYCSRVYAGGICPAGICPRTKSIRTRLWQNKWDTAVKNKPHTTKPLIGEHPSAYRSVLIGEIVLCILKLHSYRTHSYLLTITDIFNNGSPNKIISFIQHFVTYLLYC